MQHSSPSQWCWSGLCAGRLSVSTSTLANNLWWNNPQDHCHAGTDFVPQILNIWNYGVDHVHTCNEKRHTAENVLFFLKKVVKLKLIE